MTTRCSGTRALVIGDVHLIAAGTTSQFPEPGANVILSNPYALVSGVGTNIAYGLRGLGVQAELAGAVGRDTFGDAILDDLRACEIATDRIQRSDLPTSLFLIFVDSTGERTMIGYRGACEAFLLDDSLAVDDSPGWIHMSGYTMLNEDMPAAYRRLTQRARRQGVSCSLDLEGLAQAHTRVDLTDLIVLCNMHEYRAYFGTGDIRCPEEAKLLVVKAGDQGSFLADHTGVEHLPVFPAQVCDLTGAGDAFNAGFIAARLRGLDTVQACLWGNAAGALKVARRGPRVDLDAELIQRTILDVLR